MPERAPGGRLLTIATTSTGGPSNNPCFRCFSILSLSLVNVESLGGGFATTNPTEHFADKLPLACASCWPSDRSRR